MAYLARIQSRMRAVSLGRGRWRAPSQIGLIMLLAGLGGWLLFAHPQPRFVLGEAGAAKWGSGVAQAGQVTVQTHPQRAAPWAYPDEMGSAQVSGSTLFEAERLWSAQDDWEPAVAADPNAPFIYQLATRYDGPRPCPWCKLPALSFRRSSDAGATWEADHFMVETRRPQNDPQIEVATNGKVYVAWLNSYRPGVTFMKSTDGGDSWSDLITFSGGGFGRPRWSDRPVLAISPDGQAVYVAFNASDSYVAASHDAGAHFDPPVRTNQDQRYWFHSAGAVAPDGTVYFAAVDYSQDYTGDSHINVLRSGDGGLSWDVTRLATSAEMPDCPWAEGCYFGFLGPVMGLAVDSAGRVVVAYNAGAVPGQPQTIYTQTSPDGLSWSAPQAVSDVQLEHNSFPAVAAGPTPGDFRLVWQGSWDGQTDAWNTWYRRSLDGGVSWGETIRLSDQPEGAPYKHEAGYFFPYGDYLELAVDSAGRDHVIWGAGQSYTGPGGVWYTRSLP